jgi:aminoglycoside phosphotransferase (APT) family kinase protein
MVRARARLAAWRARSREEKQVVDRAESMRTGSAARPRNPDWERVFPWIESRLGGRVVGRRRQGRESGGRPAWFVDVEVDGRLVRGYLRGTRDAAFEYTRFYSTEREAGVVAALHAAGHPVPAVLGFCPDPPAILMEFVDGRDDFHQIRDTGQRDALVRHFVEILVRQHALDTRPFAAQGLEPPRRPEAFALDDLAIWEGAYQRATREPVPLLTFTCDWLRRHAPRKMAECVLVQGDTGPGNVLFDGSRIRAITDWEMAHLGDPMDDLALLRSRDLYYPIGDMRACFELYAKLSGRAIDLAAVRYYTVKAMVIVPLSLAPVMENLDPRTEHAEWIAQYLTYERTTAEALAEAMEITLEPLELPEPEPGPRAPLYEILLENLRDEQLPAIEDAYRAFRMQMTLRLALLLRNADRLGAALDAQELDDLGLLLGRRPGSLPEGRRALDRLVREHGARREEELVRYFHRHALRSQALMRGAMGMAERAELQPV